MTMISKFQVPFSINSNFLLSEKESKLRMLDTFEFLNCKDFNNECFHKSEGSKNFHIKDFKTKETFKFTNENIYPVE